MHQIRFRSGPGQLTALSHVRVRLAALASLGQFLARVKI